MTTKQRLQANSNIECSNSFSGNSQKEICSFNSNCYQFHMRKRIDTYLCISATIYDSAEKEPFTVANRFAVGHDTFTLNIYIYKLKK